MNIDYESKEKTIISIYDGKENKKSVYSVIKLKLKIKGGKYD